MTSKNRGRPWTAHEDLACVKTVYNILRKTREPLGVAELCRCVSKQLERQYSIQRTARAVYAIMRRRLSFLLPEIKLAMEKKQAAPTALPAPISHANNTRAECHRRRYERDPSGAALEAPQFDRDDDHLRILTWSDRKLDTFFRPRPTDIAAGWTPAPHL